MHEKMNDAPAYENENAISGRPNTWGVTDHTVD
jgi:hypothetical protein